MNTNNNGTGRRGFLRTAGVGAVGAAAVAVGASEAAAKAPARCGAGGGCDYDVVVIGGGFAGVTAARDSRRNGYRTLILEARNRLGGRTFTSRFAGHRIDLGGTWIHWSQPYVWAEKERYGLEVTETPEGLDVSAETIVLVHGGQRKVLTAEEMAPLAEAFEMYFADARQLWARPFDARFTWNALLQHDGLSALDRLNQLPLAQPQCAALEGYIATMGHGSLRDISYNETLRCWALCGWNFQGTNEALGRYVFKQGTASLIDAMVADGTPEVRLSTAVRKIEDQGRRAVITTQKGERITARAVIVTVPMNVLPGIAFDPPLDPRVVEAGRERHAGTGAKVFMKTRGRFDGPGKVMGLGDAGNTFSIAFTYAKGADHAIYVGFVPDPAKVDLQDRQAMQQALRTYIPDAVVEECLAYEWTLDPFSQGTWASYKPHWYGKYLDHFGKDSGRIVFGQGDHGDGWRGAIDGAISSGARAAERVRKKLGSA